MSIASKYNKGMVSFSYKPANEEFISLEALYSKTLPNTQFPIHGMYINSKSKYGPHPVLIGDDYYISLPRHMTETVQEMLKDNDIIAACNNAEIGFTIYTFESNNRTCYSINWVDF